MKLSLVSGAFLSLLLSSHTFVLCFEKSDSYSELAKEAFDKEPKHDLFHTKTKHFGYGKLAKEAFDNETKHEEALKRTTLTGSFSELAKQAYLDESKYEPLPDTFSHTAKYSSDYEKDETFKNFKFFTDDSHKRNLSVEPNRVDVEESRNLVPLNDSMYKVEKEHGFVDFLFKSHVYVKRVTFNTDTVWKWNPFRVPHPTSMSFDPFEMEFTVRDNVRWLTYKRRANGSWELVNHYVVASNFEANDYEFPHNAFNGFAIYTLGKDNVVHLNDLSAFEVKKLGKFKSIYYFKFKPGTKCVGLENKGVKMWYHTDVNTPVSDDLTLEYPTHVVFNMRASTTFVLFKWQYAGYFSNGDMIQF